MAELRIAHTADLDDGTKNAVRALLDATFSGFTDEAFENSLGGLHALLWEGAGLVGHSSVVPRRLLFDGRALRAGYVEAVAVREDRRRQGHGHTMMDALERVIRAAYDLGALGASADGAGLYAARGWLQWQGPVSALTPDGTRRTADFDGAIYILPVSTALDITRGLTCDWRDGRLW